MLHPSKAFKISTKQENQCSLDIQKQSASNLIPDSLKYETNPIQLNLHHIINHYSRIQEHIHKMYNTSKLGSCLTLFRTLFSIPDFQRLKTGASH